MNRSARLFSGVILAACGALAVAGTGCATPAVAGTAGTLAQQVPGGDPRLGREAILGYGCGACHTIEGVPGARAVVAPSLVDFASREFIAGGAIPNTPDKVIAFIQNPQRPTQGTTVLNGVLMPPMGVTESDARNIAAYLYNTGGQR